MFTLRPSTDEDWLVPVPDQLNDGVRAALCPCLSCAYLLVQV